MFKVEGYDKDHDVYVTYWQGDDLEKAKEIATILDNIAKEDELIRYISDMSTEPIDWVQVTDENDAMVFLPRQERRTQMFKHYTINDVASELCCRDYYSTVYYGFIIEAVKDAKKDLELSVI
jgi:hypothetical protein